MKIFANLFSGLGKSNTNAFTKIQREWDIARRDASRFGPSHVAEIDAIFSRQS